MLFVGIDICSVVVLETVASVTIYSKVRSS